MNQSPNEAHVFFVCYSSVTQVRKVRTTLVQLTCFFAKRMHPWNQHLGLETEPLQPQKPPHIPPSPLVPRGSLYPGFSWPGPVSVPLCFWRMYAVGAAPSHPRLFSLIVRVSEPPCCSVTPGRRLLRVVQDSRCPYSEFTPSPLPAPHE